MANNYEELTKAGLTKMCEAKGIEVKSSMKKQDIIALLEESDKKAVKEVSSQRPSRRERARQRRQKNQANAAERREKTKDATEKAREKSESASLGTLTPRVYDSAPRVHMVDDDDAGAELNPKTNKYDIELMVSMQDPLHYLTGRVLGSGRTEYQRVGDHNIAYVNALVEFGNRTVQIPSFQFFEDWMDDSKYDQSGWYKYMQERIGSEVDFTVLMRDDGPVPDYYGTRFSAMRKKRCDRWYGKMKDGSWYIKDNQVVQARVVAAREAGLVIEIEGAETFVPRTEVAHEFVTSARTYYQAGDKVFVAVSDIRRDNLPANLRDFKFPVTYRASIKKATIDPRQVYFQDFQPGTTHKATVTKVDIIGERAVFFCNVSGRADIYCWMREGIRRTPSQGEEVIVKIAGSDDESKRIWGSIIHVVEDTTNRKEFTVLDI